MSFLSYISDLDLTNLDIDDPIYGGDTLLYNASRYGTIDLVRNLITHQADVNAQGFSGPALHESINQGHNSITSYLLAHGADINLRSFNVLQDGFSPLHTAILATNDVAIKLLLEMNANLQAKDANLNTPLHLAVKEEHHYIVKLLLSHGASMSAINSNHETPFCLAVDSGNLKIVECFINHRIFEIEPRLLNDSLIRAINGQYIPVIQLILQHGADVNFVSSYNRYTPLHHAANSLPIVEILLQNGADVTARTETNSLAIFFAAHQKNESVTDLLLKKHLTSDVEASQLLYEAVMEDCELLIRRILSHGLDVDELVNGRRLLETAILENKCNSINALINCGADVELTDFRGVAYWGLALQQRNFDFFYSWLYNGGGFYHYRSRRAMYLYRIEQMIHVMRTERPGGWKVEWELRDHLIKMKCCGFFTHSEHKELTDGYGTRERDTIEGDCIKELEKLKTEVLMGVSGWELLELDDRRLGIWSRKVGGIHQMKQFDTYFYSRNWLHDCYRRGVRRRRLIKELQECFNELLKIHFDCLGAVVQYLDNDDIRSLILACEEQGQ